MSSFIINIISINYVLLSDGIGEEGNIEVEESKLSSRHYCSVISYTFKSVYMFKGASNEIYLHKTLYMGGIKLEIMHFAITSLTYSSFRDFNLLM